MPTLWRSGGPAKNVSKPKINICFFTGGTFLLGLFQIAATRKFSLRAVLNECRHSLSFMTVGRALHIFCGIEANALISTVVL